MLQGIIIGGIIFGVSMAIFGKCPETGPVSIAEGRIDVFLVGAILNHPYIWYSNHSNSYCHTKSRTFR